MKSIRWGFGRHVADMPASVPDASARFIGRSNRGSSDVFRHVCPTDHRMPGASHLVSMESAVRLTGPFTQNIPDQVGAQHTGHKEPHNGKTRHSRSLADRMVACHEYGPTDDKRSRNHRHDHAIRQAFQPVEGWLKTAWPGPDLKGATLEISEKTPLASTGFTT